MNGVTIDFNNLEEIDTERLENMVAMMNEELNMRREERKAILKHNVMVAVNELLEEFPNTYFSVYVDDKGDHELWEVSLRDFDFSKIRDIDEKVKW